MVPNDEGFFCVRFNITNDPIALSQTFYLFKLSDIKLKYEIVISSRFSLQEILLALLSGQLSIKSELDKWAAFRRQ